MILIVDDDPAFLSAAEQEFGRSEAVYFARDAEHAVALMSAIGKDCTVALIDLDLPTVDGFQLIRRLRKLGSSLPIVAISGVARGAALESACEVGATAVLRKPITPDWKRVIERLRAAG